MAAELRWILLGLSLLLLAGIWWWGSRRSAQAPGNAELREITSAPEPRAAEEPVVREWASPFEPLSIRTGEYEQVPVLDGPMMVSADPAPSITPSSLAESSSGDGGDDGGGVRRRSHAGA